MSFSGYAEDEIKKKVKLKDKLKCKICKFGSPKYWQLVLNDLPLLIAIQVAYFLNLIDKTTMLVALFYTISDSISMIIYLLHDDELSVNAKDIYQRVDLRIAQNQSYLTRLEINSDDDHLLEVEEAMNVSARLNEVSHAFDGDGSARMSQGTDRQKLVEI